jgi:DNA-directed RNA polymerase subunit beta'
MIETTVGSILINEVLPEPIRDYKNVFDKKIISKIYDQIGHKYPTQYADIAKKLKDIGDKYAFLLGSSYSISDMKPVDVTPITNKYKAEYDKALKIEDKKKRNEVLKQINQKVESEINSIVEKEKSNPNPFSEWISSGARGDSSDLRQIKYAVGNMVDVTNNLYPHMVTTSLSKGLSPTDFYVMSLGARKGIVGSFISVRDPGAYGKELFTLTNDMVITEQDCKTTQGLEYDINDTHALDRCLLEPVGPYKKNDVVTEMMVKVLKEKNVNKIKVRSPIYCKAREGVCAYCFGLSEDGTMPKIGDTVGLRSAQALTEKLTQMALSDKHTGGVVKTKSPFELVKQLSHIPESFPGGAVLSRVNGVVSKIENNFDGGKKVIIANTEHYLSPSQQLKVKVGDKVEIGTPLSSGLVNPAEVVKLKGIEEGRKSWANSVQQVYADAGIKGHSKVFETVSRAILNHGEVENPGDHDLDPGKIVRWNQHMDFTKPQEAKLLPKNAIGWRLKHDIPGTPYKKDQLITTQIAEELAKRGNMLIEVYKKPATIVPVVVGTERGAIHKEDWLSNLGFRYLKENLLDNVATGATANIHSFNPIPAYIYGAEFGKGTDGKF